MIKVLIIFCLFHYLNAYFNKPNENIQQFRGEYLKDIVNVHIS